MLGIIGAMDEEVAKLKEKMEQVHIVEKAGMQFYRGSLCDREVVIVKCGVGKVHAAMCTQAMIDLFPVWNCKYRNRRFIKCRDQYRRYCISKGCVRA